MPTTVKNDFKKPALLAARAADDKKAEDIKVYYIGENSSLADYAVIATADSAPQLEAVADGVAHSLKEEGLYRLHSEGGRSDSWRVLDYGGFIMHVVTNTAREFYGLDRIYHFGREIRWEARAAASAAKPAPAKKAAPKKTTVKKAAARKPAVKKPAVRRGAAKAGAARKSR
ncbi:MAG: ribosome silencing factor [Elusimicrobiales bacterium]|nr:ribosome silencing factor [Elusimicrobiales bacterium]